jgi:O-antigen/teichoic acid export membrane protein
MAVRGLAEGLQEVHRLNLASALSVLVAAPLTLLALELWPSALWLYLPLAAVNVAGPLIVLPALWRQYGGIERAAGWSLAVGCELLRRGAWFTVVGAAWAVIYGVDVWVVQRFCGLSEVASYGLSFMLFGLLAEPLAALVMALRPIAGRLGASGSTAPAVLFRKTVRLAVVAGISVNGAGLLWFGLAMDIWVGATVDGDFRVAFFLASFQALRALLNSCAWILVPVDGPRRLGLALTVDAAVNLVASMCLAREVGPWGVAAGSLLGILSCSGWYVPLRARQAFQIPLFGPWLPVAIIAAAPLWILGLIWRPRLATFSGPAGPLTAACCLGATAVVVLTLIWFAGLEDQERDLVRNRIRRSR